MKTHAIQVTFTFKGTVQVQASTKQQAKEIVEQSFGLTLGGNLHHSDSNIVDWNFDSHPDKVVRVKF